MCWPSLLVTQVPAADPVPSPLLVGPSFIRCLHSASCPSLSREGHRAILWPLPVVTLALTSLAGQENSDSPLCQ